jgi:hypothetical protein
MSITDSSNIEVIATNFLEDIITNNIRPQLINRRFEFQSPSLSPNISAYDIFTEMPIENLILNSYGTHNNDDEVNTTSTNQHSNRPLRRHYSLPLQDLSDNYTSSTLSPTLSPTLSSTLSSTLSPTPTLPQIPSIFNVLNTTLGTSYREIPRISEIINNSLYDSDMYKKVLSEKGKASLIKISFKEALNNEKYATINKSCPIMQCDFEEEETITILPCKHAFHSEAIERWLKEEKSQCPICRYELDSTEEKITNTPPPTTTTTTTHNNVRRNLETILFSSYNRGENISRLQRRNRRLYQIQHTPTNHSSIGTTMNQLIERESNDVLQQVILESIQQQQRGSPSDEAQAHVSNTTPTTTMTIDSSNNS